MLSTKENNLSPIYIKKLKGIMPKDYFNIIATMVNVIEQKDPYTRDHSHRVMKICVLVAKQLDMPPQDILLLHHFGYSNRQKLS